MIKPDSWIIRKAAAGMIDPFEPGQIRQVNGKKVISYGTSSYGYDLPEHWELEECTDDVRAEFDDLMAASQ